MRPTLQSRPMLTNPHIAAAKKSLKNMQQGYFLGIFICPPNMQLCNILISLEFSNWKTGTSPANSLTARRAGRIPGARRST
jgi:hypothetical protein